MDYSVKIDAFEGPLDLLLHLIKKSNISIYDISVEEITNQYLDYINKMEELNIDVASSYLVMAASLVELKSKSLLPHKEEKEDDNDEEELSRDSLINRLVEYQKYKDITSKFKELELERDQIYIKPPENINNYVSEKITSEYGVSSELLVEAFEKLLERKNFEKPLLTKITNKEYSVRQRKSEIKKILSSKKTVEFSELFEVRNISYVITTFLSILEMAREDDLIIKQDDNFKNIYIELKVK